ncbi:hypothetical protein QW7_3646 [Clostridioides difficile P77]|nr:hypothetical protein [Clostridioides difficile]EQK36549.1 hypothetical protein QW7_3646 [Clostridioides difficile P77]
MVKLSYGALVGFLGNSISTIIAICVGGIVYVVVILGIGGIKKEEILTMPKGDKLYKLLKKVKLIR